MPERIPRLAVATFFAVDVIVDRPGEGPIVLVKLGLVERRYKAMSEVFDGAPVTEVPTRYGVTRQTVHTWLRHYPDGALAALADKSSRPDRCLRQSPRERRM